VSADPTGGGLGRLHRGRQAARRAVHGDRPFEREDLVDWALEQAADAVVYVRLERVRWRRTGPVDHKIDSQAAALALTVTALGTEIARCALRSEGRSLAVCRGRLRQGRRRFGDAYLRRDNLAAALEDLADCAIALRLEANRRVWLGLPDPDAFAALQLRTLAARTACERLRRKAFAARETRAA